MIVQSFRALVAGGSGNNAAGEVEVTSTKKGLRGSTLGTAQALEYSAT
jgi:hypothetical protein